MPKYILEKNIRIRLLNPSFEVKKNVEKNVKKEHELVIKRKNQKNKRIFNIENFIREYEFDPTRINIYDLDRISVGIPNERLNNLKKISTILNEPPTKVLLSQKK